MLLTGIHVHCTVIEIRTGSWHVGRWSVRASVRRLTAAIRASSQSASASYVSDTIVGVAIIAVGCCIGNVSNGVVLRLF